MKHVERSSHIYICYDPPFVSEKPTDIDVGYKILVPYEFEWRPKLGRVTCDCTEVVERYRPWIGFDWSHTPECAIFRHLERYPGIQNLMEVSEIIAHTL